MKIKQALFTAGYSSFYFDDQQAIKNGADHDGFIYTGAPVTPGFTSVRQAGECISVQLILENGAVAVGYCAAVQYSGARFGSAYCRPDTDRNVCRRFPGKILFEPRRMDCL